VRAADRTDEIIEIARDTSIDVPRGRLMIPLSARSNERRSKSPGFPHLAASLSRFVLFAIDSNDRGKPNRVRVFSIPIKRGRPRGKSRPRANPVWGRGGWDGTGLAVL